MKTSSKMLFASMMIMSTIMVVSSTNWLNMWLGMEMNMMSFIPLMFNSKNNFLSQSSMMYFLIQSLASTMFMATIMSKMLVMEMENDMLTKYMIMMPMMMKMGMPPFHFWFPEMMNKMSWNMCLILTTWQKVAPLYIASQVITDDYKTMTIIILTTMVGAILGLNQTSTRKMMAYSSINHLGWMMSCAMTFKKSWIIYMMLYSSMMLMLCMILHQSNIMYINQFNFSKMKMTEKMMIMFMMMSMGGLPPFLGFLPKWIAINNMMALKKVNMMLLMLWSSMMILSYYMRMTSSMSMMMMHSQKWMTSTSTKKSLTSKMFIMNMMFPIIILMINFN